MTPRPTPAHINRVLSALGGIATADPREPVLWLARCPHCGGRLEVRDVDWQQRERRARLYCWLCDEARILRAIGLRDRDLFLKGRDAPAVSGARRATAELVRRLTAVLGAPVATPELVSPGGGKLTRASWRIWRWDCPSCWAGELDPDRIYRPFAVTSDGLLWCRAGCSDNQLRAALCWLGVTA